MNRLTRKTTKEDYERKAKSYWMGEDESTSEQFLEKYPYTITKGFRFHSFNEYLNKLGRLEDLEEELGCPLEVVVKIMLGKIDEIVVNYSDSGGYATPYCEYTRAFVDGIYLEYNDKWVIDTQLCTIPIEDYHKEWWQKGEVNEEDI